ncbi:ABC transporter ATP-binding protein [candidate division CSSED10-310 bacterium]|uniref:ABC transporter ATP-binding protein n=1 Tax=candidate division CSSED10-310 bacterium TaxID=2855610 RepID=A0ABV6Z1U5_UNCC1
MPFILDGLDTEAYDRNYSDLELLRRIMRYFSPFSGYMVLVSIALALNSIAGTAGPIVVSKSIDIVASDPRTKTIFLFAVAVMMLGATGWFFNYIRQRITARVVGDVVLTLRQDVFRRTIEHDMSFYDAHPSGKIVSRVTSDTQDFSHVVTLVIDVLSQFLLVVFLTGWLFTIHVGLTLLLLIMTPLAVTIALSFRKLARAVTQDSRRINATINAQIQESISGIVVAKSYRQEQRMYETFIKNNEQSYRIGLRRGVTLTFIFPIMSFAAGIGTAILVFFGGLAMKADGISPGNWYLFMQAVGFYWWPLMSIASFWSQFQDGLSAAERVFALIDAKHSVRQHDHLETAAIKGKIEFREVQFSYKDEEMVLPDFSLTIPQGVTLALVGHTGAGKSSIARLITRFYEFQQGDILIDGLNIRSFDLNHLKKHIGLVPQDPYLFSGTVADNIRYGRPEATDDEVCFAATQVGQGDWLHDLPEGLKTETGARGASISLGQRQLVALARVLLKNPAIFILDEATASIDPFTESRIQEGLTTVMKNRTTLVIAHRLSTVKNADLIIVLDQGRIIERGNHSDLLRKKGHYAELYNTYFRYQSLEYIEQFDQMSSKS